MYIIIYVYCVCMNVYHAFIHTHLPICTLYVVHCTLYNVNIHITHTIYLGYIEHIESFRYQYLLRTKYGL